MTETATLDGSDGLLVKYKRQRRSDTATVRRDHDLLLVSTKPDVAF